MARFVVGLKLKKSLALSAPQFETSTNVCSACIRVQQCVGRSVQLVRANDQVWSVEMVNDDWQAAEIVERQIDSL